MNRYYQNCEIIAKNELLNDDYQEYKPVAQLCGYCLDEFVNSEEDCCASCRFLLERIT